MRPKTCLILIPILIASTVCDSVSDDTIKMASTQPHPAINRTFMISVLLTFPPICIVGQLILVYIVFIKKRKKYTSAFFKFLLLLIIAALYWLFLLTYEGLCLLMDRCPFGEMFNTVLMSNAIFFYDMCMWSTLFVSFNRFSAIFFPHQYNVIFSKKLTILYIMIVIVGSAAINSPNWVYLLKYSTEIATWTYVNTPSVEMLENLKLLELIFAYIIHAAVFILYLSAFIRYRQRSTKSAKLRKDYRLMIQGTLGSVACFIFLTFHHVWKVPTVEFLAVLFCIGSDPFVYLGFNTDIRNDFKELIKGLKGNGKVEPSRTETSAHHLSHAHQTIDSKVDNLTRNGSAC